MALETDLQLMARHIADKLETNKAAILVGADQAFQAAVYGEPAVIQFWPLCAVLPVEFERSLDEGAARKFQIVFRIDVFIYHGTIESHLGRQEGAHKRIQAVNDFFMSGTNRSFKWNFVDETSASDKVIFGYPRLIDHPVLLAPEEEMWAASRLELTGLSEEVF